MAKELSKIKNGEKVVAASMKLDRPAFFDDIQRHTSLETKILTKALAELHKHGYMSKSPSGLWEYSKP